MTRKDFELIAAAINGSSRTLEGIASASQCPDEYRMGWEDARVNLAYELADNLTDTNPRFDRARFLEAAGV